MGSVVVFIRYLEHPTQFSFKKHSMLTTFSNFPHFPTWVRDMAKPFLSVAGSAELLMKCYAKALEACLPPSTGLKTAADLSPWPWVVATLGTNRWLPKTTKQWLPVISLGLKVPPTCSSSIHLSPHWGLRPSKNIKTKKINLEYLLLPDSQNHILESFIFGFWLSRCPTILHMVVTISRSTYIYHTYLRNP